MALASLQCTSCHSSDVAEDAVRGVICQQCGSVLSEGVLRATYDMDGLPSGGKTMVFDGESSFRNVLHDSRRTGVYRPRHTSERARALAVSRWFTRMTRIGQSLMLPVNELDQVKYLMTQAVAGNWRGGRRMDRIAGACIYVLCRQKGRAITMTDIAEAVSCDIFDLGREYYRVKKLLRVSLVDTEPATYMERAVRQLELGPRKGEILNLAVKIADLAKRESLDTGRHPVALAAAAISWAMQAQGLDSSVHKLADALRTNRRTVSMRRNELAHKFVELSKKLPFGTEVTEKNVGTHIPFLVEHLNILKDRRLGASASNDESGGANTGQYDCASRPPAFARGEKKLMERMRKLERVKQRLASMMPTGERASVAPDDIAVLGKRRRSLSPVSAGGVPRLAHANSPAASARARRLCGSEQVAQEVDEKPVVVRPDGDADADADADLQWQGTPVQSDEDGEGEHGVEEAEEGEEGEEENAAADDEGKKAARNVPVPSRGAKEEAAGESSGSDGDHITGGRQPLARRNLQAERRQRREESMRRKQLEEDERVQRGDLDVEELAIQRMLLAGVPEHVIVSSYDHEEKVLKMPADLDRPDLGPEDISEAEMGQFVRTQAEVELAKEVDAELAADEAVARAEYEASDDYVAKAVRRRKRSPLPQRTAEEIAMDAVALHPLLEGTKMTVGFGRKSKFLNIEL